MGNHTDSSQLVPFLNNLIVMKMVTVSDLCLTYVIFFILIYALGPFSLQITLNDSYLVQLYIIFNQNDG